METLEQRKRALQAVLEAFFCSKTPEIAPEAVVEPYTCPKDPIYPPNPALTAGMALPTPHRSALEAFLHGIHPQERLGAYQARLKRLDEYASVASELRKLPKTAHPPRWHTSWTRAEIVDLERRRLAGASLRDLGKIRGVSAARISQVLAKARRLRRTIRLQRTRSGS